MLTRHRFRVRVFLQGQVESEDECDADELDADELDDDNSDDDDEQEDENTESDDEEQADLLDEPEEEIV